jgi:transcriptional regulator with XRE-family HTH domain
MESYLDSLLALGERARRLRLLRDLQQRELASRAGIGIGTVQRFERTGRASIANVLRIANALGAEEGFARLFELPRYSTLDEALARPRKVERQRVRRRA